MPVKLKQNSYRHCSEKKKPTKFEFQKVVSCIENQFFIIINSSSGKGCYWWLLLPEREERVHGDSGVQKRLWGPSRLEIPGVSKDVVWSKRPQKQKSVNKTKTKNICISSLCSLYEIMIALGKKLYVNVNIFNSCFPFCNLHFVRDLSSRNHRWF